MGMKPIHAACHYRGLGELLMRYCQLLGEEKGFTKLSASVGADNRCS